MNTAAVTVAPAASRTVSRQLAAAGFTRSQTHATGVRGYARSTRGFHVEQQRGVGEVRVDHHAGGSRVGDSAVQDRTDSLARYADALGGLGYTVRLGDTGTYLLVTR